MEPMGPREQLVLHALMLSLMLGYTFQVVAGFIVKNPGLFGF